MRGKTPEFRGFTPVRDKKPLDPDGAGGGNWRRYFMASGKD